MTRHRARWVSTALAAALGLLLAACATVSRPPVEPPPAAPSAQKDSAPESGTAVKPGSADKTPELSKIYNGTGVVVAGQAAGGQVPQGVKPPARPGSAVTLNFEAADIREVVRNILGDILNESYTIDPAVGGTVTIRTTSGIPRESLHATMEMLLRMNGATMTREDGIWKILPAAAAARGNVSPQLGGSSRPLPAGYSVQIVPLHYVGARQMAALLEPFVKDQTTVRVDELRNLLILSGTELELQHLYEAIDMFDVNWLAGMSVGVFTLQSTDVKSLMADLDKAMGTPDKSPLAGIVRIIPIERLNALLVVTPQQEYLDEAKKWIERLDRAGGEGTSIRFYVYQVQNGRSEYIAPLLQQAFTGRVTQPAAATGPPQVAPGTPAGTIVSPPAFQPQSVIPVQNPTPVPQTVVNQTQTTAGANVPGATMTPGSIQSTIQRALTGGASGDGIGVVRNVQVVADKDNNTILVVATPSEYSVIEAALKKLDIPQRQVAIELTIAEITLTDQLQFGVEWLFKGAAPSGRGSGGLFNQTTPFNPAVPLAAAAGAASGPVGLALATGFNYLINNANFPGGVQAALHLLDTYGNTKVVSNPHIAALDNQKATIKVGNRIPINQQTLVGGTTNAVTTTAQYIDTGVLVQVTPHINAGGLVTLEVDAEVSTPGTTTDPTVAPPINTRSVQTLLAVPSGSTMVMGGLITENNQNNSAGLPGLARIPILGGLFGNQTLQKDRTELILFITPRVVENELDYRRIIEDLRRKMERLDEVFPAKTAP
ncbi:MAG TPA: type II secretion system secretin GspD [Casimicrobiaceae bacterium]|nr:type II secretion system secretin GspD [Casimicrobiaceae bacterium]